MTLVDDLGDDFIRAVGRITLLASMLDQRLIMLATALRRRRQTEAQLAEPLGWDARSGAEMVKEARRDVDTVPPELRTALFAHLKECSAVLDERHVLVHAIWLRDQDLRRWFGIKSNRPAKRKPAVEPVTHREVATPDLLVLTMRLDAITAAIEKWIIALPEPDSRRAAIARRLVRHDMARRGQLR